VIRGERLIKLGDSWFSAKFIEVKRLDYFLNRVKQLIILGDRKKSTYITETLNMFKIILTVRMWVLRSMFEREIAQIYS
jgi:hypothetical protein